MKNQTRARLVVEKKNGVSYYLKTFTRYLEDKKRKNKLKKQGLWEEVQRRERLDEEHAGAGFDGENEDNGTTGGGGGRQRSSGGGGGGGGQNRGMLGRADAGDGSELPQKEHIRCAFRSSGRGGLSASVV